MSEKNVNMAESKTTPAELQNNASENSAPEASAAETTGNNEKTGWRPKKNDPLSTVFFICLIVAGVLAVLYAWDLPPFIGHTVSTDNAYVRGQTTLISPKVGGYVEEVLVKDFAQVKKGDALVKIDDKPYAARVEQAKAGLALQLANKGKISQGRTSSQANIDARKTAIHNAEVQLQLARVNMQRFNDVRGSEGIAKREYDQAKSSLEQAEAALAQAQAQYIVAQQDALGVETNKEGLDASISNARATLDLAKQDLEHSIVYAPEDGRLGEVSVKKGQFVSTGSQLMFIVPPKRWIIANFKENDTAHIKVGQSASISVDALGGKKFKGKVSEIAPATSAEFSVIRADSGTGNFVKIAQRIPIKIELDNNQKEVDRLTPGMSVEADINTSSNGGSK